MKNPLVKYGIDRDCLNNSGMSAQSIDHLYRALFVYSIGFYNLVKELIEKTKDLKEGIHKGLRF